MFSFHEKVKMFDFMKGGEECLGCSDYAYIKLWRRKTADCDAYWVSFPVSCKIHLYFNELKESSDVLMVRSSFLIYYRRCCKYYSSMAEFGCWNFLYWLLNTTFSTAFSLGFCLPLVSQLCLNSGLSSESFHLNPVLQDFSFVWLLPVAGCVISLFEMWQ